MSKKQFAWIAAAFLCLGLAACGGTSTAGKPPPAQGSESSSSEPAPEESGVSQMLVQPSSAATVRLTFGENEAIISLADNATTRDFVSQLPLTQSFEDFNQIEKICRLPDTLAIDGVERGYDPDVADITLYVPWNTLVFYYKDYGYHENLIPMGRVESGMELLEAQNEDFTVTMELLKDFAPNSAVATSSTQTHNITMTAGETVITATLNNSEVSKEFLATLPRTISMSEYGGREFYGRIEEMTGDGTAISTFENGDVTYYPGGPSLALFYAKDDTSSQGGLIRMGEITSDLSVFETLGESVELRIERAD